MFIKLLSILKEIIIRFKVDDLSARASKLTYYILLSIFPLLIFVIEILRRIEFTSPNMIFMITEFFPQEIASFFEYIIADITNVTAPSSLISVTIIATLWTASRGILAIIQALNIAYKEEETRSFVFIRLISIIYTVALIVILIVTFTLIVFGQKLFELTTNFIPIILTLENIISYLRYLFSIIFTYLFFTLLYNVIPNRKISFKEVIPGAIFATLSFVVLSVAFSIYVSNATSLSYMYGSLTSIIILLLWLYAISMIILIGGELNAIISARKAKNH